MLTVVPVDLPPGGQAVAINRPGDEAVEAYRGPRTNGQFLWLGRPIDVIQLTISLAGEGKTRTNLAVVLASAGYCVALVDANLRRSRSPIDFDGTNRMSIYPSVDGNFAAGLDDGVTESSVADRGEQTPSRS